MVKYKEITLKVRIEDDIEGDKLKRELLTYIAVNPLKYINLHNMAYEVSDHIHKPKD